MNTKSIIAAAIALAAGTAFASSVHAGSITTLNTVQVRPSSEQVAQAAVERNSSIPTLAVVEVRPSADQLSAYAAELATSQRIVTLAAVEVRPSSEQRLALAAEQGNSDYVGTLTAVATALANEVITTFPVMHVRPSQAQQAQLQAIAVQAAVEILR